MFYTHEPGCGGGEAPRARRRRGGLDFAFASLAKATEKERNTPTAAPAKLSLEEARVGALRWIKK